MYPINLIIGSCTNQRRTHFQENTTEQPKERGNAQIRVCSSNNYNTAPVRFPSYLFSHHSRVNQPGIIHLYRSGKTTHLWGWVQGVDELKNNARHSINSEVSST